MSDPAPQAWDYAKWLGAAVVAMLAWVGRGHDERIRKLEEERQTKADAQQQREDLRDAIARLQDDMTRIFERLDDLADRLPRRENR